MKKPEKKNKKKKTVKNSKIDIKPMYDDSFIGKYVNALESLLKKSKISNFPFETLHEVYVRGLDSWNESKNQTREQYAFARVNSFINEGLARALDSDLLEGEYIPQKTERDYAVRSRVGKTKSFNIVHVRDFSARRAESQFNRGGTFRNRSYIKTRKAVSTPHRAQQIKKRISRSIVETNGAGFDATDALVSKYKHDTPGQYITRYKKIKKKMNEDMQSFITYLAQRSQQGYKDYDAGNVVPDELVKFYIELAKKREIKLKIIDEV